MGPLRQSLFIERGRSFDMSPDALFIATVDGTVRLANPAWARVLGCTQQDIVSRPFVNTLHPDDVEAIEAVLVRHAAGIDVVGFECRHLCADGSARWFEWKTRAAPDEGLLYGVGRDVTERRLVNDELDALRHIATLVARGVRPSEVFAAVSAEVGRLFSGMGAIGRFEHHTPTIVVEGSQETAVNPPIGSRWELGEGFASADVYRTGRSARVDARNWMSATVPLPDPHHSRSGATVASPIFVDGRLWGTISVTTTQRPPEDIEQRLEKFSELVATAIANVEARETLARLADEQAALRRIGVSIAHGVPPGEIFAAVCDEAKRLFGYDLVSVGSFDADGPAIVAVGASKSFEELIPIGTRWGLEEHLATTQVFRTGRAARGNARDWTSLSGPIAASLRQMAVVSAVASPIWVDDRLWGAMTVTSNDAPLPPDTEERLARFTELVSTAIANAEGRVQLAASRRRIVTASDEARRRIERDLHDGTQQRLVSLGLAVRAAEATIGPDRDDLRRELSSIVTGLAEAVTDLREMSRGIHPVVLSRGGLGPALRTLARRSTIPVDVDVSLDARLAEPIEVAAYFVASEALANAAKHSDASSIDVSLGARDDVLVVSVRDDGVGGANAERGSGLVGLLDRVEALGGVFTLRSPPGHGTHITAELPLELRVEGAPAHPEPPSGPGSGAG